MLNVSPENLIITVINLLILTVALRVLLFKPVLKIIAQRQEEVDKELDEAKQVKKEAE